MYDFDVKAQGNRYNRDRAVMKLLKSTGLRTSAFGLSNTIFLTSVPFKLCDRLNFLQQEKQSANNCDIINDEIVALFDKLLEYRCLSSKHHKQILIECNLLHTKKK